MENCNACGADWCEAVGRGQCIEFNFNDGKHILGPTTRKLGCGALATNPRYKYYRKSFCIAGSDDIYAVAKHPPPELSRALDFDPASCVSTSRAADTAWCVAFCKTPNCLSSSGMCECGHPGTNGRRQNQLHPQPKVDDDRYVRVVPS